MADLSHGEEWIELPHWRVVGMDVDAATLARNALADFEHVLLCVDHLDAFHRESSTAPHPLTPMVYESALVTYVRGFDTARQHGWLSEKVIESSLGAEAVAAHKYFRGVRNKHIAHRVPVGLEGAMCFAVEDDGDFVLSWLRVRRIADAEYPALRNLVVFLRNELHKRSDELGQVVMDRLQRDGLDSIKGQQHGSVHIGEYTPPGGPAKSN